MGADIINTALQLLKDNSISNYAIAKATGISKPTIAKYRAGETVPNEVYAEKIVNYITSTNKTGATQTDNTIINPTNTQAMEISLAMDYIATLKEQLAKMTAIVENQNTVIERLSQKGGDEVLSRKLGAVKERRDEELMDKP